MDWEEIRNEYVTTKTSYRKLAEKYGVSFNVLMKKGAAEKWKDIRQKTGRKRAEKTQEKIIEKTAELQADRVVKIDNCSDLLIDKITKAINVIEIDDIRNIRLLVQCVIDLKNSYSVDKGQNDTDSSDEVITLLDKIANEQ